MPTVVVDVPIAGFDGESLTVNASDGIRRAYHVERGAIQVVVEPAAALRISLVPKIVALLFWDDSAAQWIDILKEYPDFLNRRNAVTLPVLNGMTSADRLYIGTVGQIGGAYIVIGTVNAESQTLSSTQYSRRGGWATLTITDGTEAGGVTLATSPQSIIFTDPGEGAWTRDALPEMQGVPPGAPNYTAFWARIGPSGTLTAGTTITELTPLARTASTTASTSARTGGGYFKASTEYHFPISTEIGSMELMAQAASATTMNTSWVKPE